MLTTLITFLPVAILLTITPGVATVLVIRTAARDGRRAALATTAGNSLGVLTWALAAVLPAVAAMALLIVALDLVWYSLLAAAVARAREAFVRGGWLKRADRACGAVLVGLSVRLALEQR